MAVLEMMHVPLSARICEPISTIDDKDTSKWLRVLRIDLQNP
jgi:hypothetical protein